VKYPKKTLQVLIVEDSRVDTELINRVLKKGNYTVDLERVETEESMVEALKKKKWDIIISDYYMPRFSGLEALEIAKKRVPGIPFILVSGVIGEDAAVEAMKKGAHDFITKEKMKRLVPAVKRELEEAAMRRKKKEAEERIKHLNKVLNSIRYIAQLIAREKDKSVLMKKVCENFVKTNEYSAAWIALLDDDKSITKIEKAGSGIGFLEHIKENSKLDCVKKAITSSEIQNSTELAKICQKCSFRGTCPGGITISPMSYENKIYGTMAILHPAGFVPDTEEKNLLKEVSDDLGFAFHNIDLEEESSRNKKKLKESLEKVQKFLDGTVKALSSVVEKRDPYTAGHQKRVAELAVALGKELGLNEERLEVLRIASLLHDIGKIYIREGILNKLSKLDNLEMSLIKTHPKEGYEILKSVDFPGPVAEIVLQHHERLDGSGYPEGLTGDKIRLESKILAVADVFEALTSDRPYRSSFTFDYTMKKISDSSGKLYDREIVEICIKLFKEKAFSFDKE
jgi:putative nucleotidyltransferase with HDIG domain